MLRASCLSHFLIFDNCVTPDMTSKKKKRPPSLNLGKFLMINQDIFLSGLSLYGMLIAVRFGVHVKLTFRALALRLSRLH